jgi:hypothetical protein
VDPASTRISTPSTRALGLVMLGFAPVLFVVNYGLSAVLGIYFPFLLLPIGPLLTMGTLIVIHPRFLDTLLDSERKRGDMLFRWISIPMLIFGLLLGVLLWARFRGDLS